MNYSESYFIKLFKNNIDCRNIFGFDCVLIDELKTSNGIPDAILVNKTNFNELKKYNSFFSYKGLSDQQAKILSVISNSFHTQKYLINKANIEEKKFRILIRDLIKSKIIFENEKGLLKLNNEFNIPKIDFWSLEFKLHDWKSAIRQSIIYRSFSRVVIVIMPFQKEKVLRKNSNYFKKFGIGCVIYSPEKNKIQYIVKPTRVNKISHKTYINLLGKVAQHDLVMA